MRKLLVIGCVITLLIGTAPMLWAQEENLSANRAWGVGARFLPSALDPMVPRNIDPALGSALALQIWVNELLGLEAGGWASSFSDTWSQNASTLLSGGLLFKLSDNSKFDLYFVGRGISLRNVSKNMCCVILEPRPEPQPAPPTEPKNIVPPWPAFESRSSTLAIEVAGGIEWGLAPQVALDFEFGLIYAQTVTTNVPPPPPPLPPEEPKPLQKPETFASSSLGLMLHIGVYFYFERSRAVER